MVELGYVVITPVRRSRDAIGNRTRERETNGMDEAQARRTLKAAGLTQATRGAAREPDLLAFGENAVFAVGDLVVKVGREAALLARAERELAVVEAGSRRPGSRRSARPSRSRGWWMGIR